MSAIFHPDDSPLFSRPIGRSSSRGWTIGVRTFFPSSEFSAGANGQCDDMLKGTRDAVLRKIQPISIHGQMSWEIVFTHLDDPEEQLRAARVGPEAIDAGTLEAGDHVRLEYL